MTQRRRQRTRTCTASRGRSGGPAGQGCNPVIKVEDLAWLEFEKPDLDAAERFAHDFGLATAYRSEAELHLRGTLPGSQAVIIRRAGGRGSSPRLPGLVPGGPPAPGAPTGTDVRERRGPGGGAVVELADPVGMPVRVVADVDELPQLPQRSPLTLNFGEARRINVPQRPPRAPGQVERLGHVVLETPSSPAPWTGTSRISA